MNKKMRIMLSVLALLSVSALGVEPKGGLFGTVVDKDTGEALIGVAVRLEPTQTVVFTDINGRYTVPNVAPGTYSLVAAMDGFSSARVDEVIVKPGESTRTDIQMGLSSFYNELVVTAETNKESDVSLLSHRQKSINVSDAIGADYISRTGGGDAADAVSKITGATVKGGKYIFVRGLGGRYTSTHLNGVELPTTSPDSKAFQADLFPTEILEKIVTVKSFTPDKPGNFSGGIVDIGTKQFPSEFSFKIGLSMGTNSVTTGKDEFLSYPGSGSDWMGYDDGLRALPDMIDPENPNIPDINSARFNEEEAQLLDAFTRAFEPVMAPSTSTPKENLSFSLGVGNKFELFSKEVGFNFSLKYSNKYEFKPDQDLARWKLTENANVAGSLINQSNFDAQTGSEKADWGGLFSGHMMLSPNSEISMNIIYSQSGESQASYYHGQWPEQFSSDNAYLESRVLKYTERNLQSFQFKGQHNIPAFKDMKVEWVASSSTTKQDEPDTRIFTNNYSDRVINGEPIKVYSITPSNYNHPARYFRDLEETFDSFQLHNSIPFAQANGKHGKIKFGYSLETKDRTFNELRFEYRSESNIRYNGDPDFFFSEENIGLFGYNEQTRRYEFGNVIQLSPDPRGGNYSGDETVEAYYLMGEFALSRSLRAIAGARSESIDMTVTNADTEGFLDNSEILPSLNLIYEIGPRTNVRFSYGKTLARPTFREKAPYSSYDFLADGIFVGNPDLKSSSIDNLDLRYEFFPRAGEILAASVFTKDFTDPIEKAYNVKTTSDFGETTFLNVDSAEVQGVELEFRKRFDWLVVQKDGSSIFSVGANISLIESEVAIPEEEYLFILQRDPEASRFRELQGQSDIIFNLSLQYDHITAGSSATLVYNHTGKSLDEVGIGGAPNAYVQPRDMLDFTFFQDVKKSFTVKFVVKNILDSEHEITQDFKGVQYQRIRFNSGRSFNLGLTYKP